MKKSILNFNRIFLILLFAVSFTYCSKENVDPQKNYQYLVNVVVEKHITKEEIINMVDDLYPSLNIGSSPFAVLFIDIDVASITYKTTGVNGQPVVASGVVAIPSGVTSYDHLLSIQHATLDMGMEPSRQLFYSEMIPVILKHIVVMADYLGYGTTQTADRQHPYLHIESTGIVCADMIEAAREYLDKKGIAESDNKLDLIGYSQGGTSTIATLLELENRGNVSRIRSVHAGGGAYDLMLTLQFLVGQNREDYPYMAYIPYLIRGMSYGEQITLNDTNIYAPELIDNNIPAIFSTQPLSQWNKVLGKEVDKVLHPDFFASPTFNGNPDILKLVGVLEKNSLVNYDLPNVPVHLYHSLNDDVVPYDNATIATTKWKNATLTELSMLGHNNAGVEFVLRYMGIWGLLQP